MSTATTTATTSATTTATVSHLSALVARLAAEFDATLSPAYVEGVVRSYAERYQADDGDPAALAAVERASLLALRSRVACAASSSGNRQRPSRAV